MYNAIFSFPTEYKDEDVEEEVMKEVEEEKEDSHMEIVNIYWDFYLELGYKEDLMEEICTIDYNA